MGKSKTFSNIRIWNTQHWGALSYSIYLRITVSGICTSDPKHVDTHGDILTCPNVLSATESTLERQHATGNPWISVGQNWREHTQREKKGERRANTELFQPLLLRASTAKESTWSAGLCLIQHTINFCDADGVGLHAYTNKFDENWQNAEICPGALY